MTSHGVYAQPHKFFTTSQSNIHEAQQSHPGVQCEYDFFCDIYGNIMARSKRPSKRSRSRVRRRTRRTRTRISRQRSPKRRVSRRRYRAAKPSSVSILTVISDISNYLLTDEGGGIDQSLRTYVSQGQDFSEIESVWKAVNELLHKIHKARTNFELRGTTYGSSNDTGTGADTAPTAPTAMIDIGAARTLLMFQKTLQMLTIIRRISIAVGDNSEEQWRRKMALITLIIGVLFTIVPFARAFTIGEGVGVKSYIFSGTFAISTISVTLTALLYGNDVAKRKAPMIKIYNHDGSEYREISGAGAAAGEVGALASDVAIEIHPEIVVVDESDTVNSVRQMEIVVDGDRSAIVRDGSNVHLPFEPDAGSTLVVQSL